MIASREGLKGSERALAAGLHHSVVARKGFADVASFSREVFAQIQASGAELICLAGWLSLLEIPSQYVGRMMNIHPALLPSFGGKGMYGHFVHEAVLAHGCKVSGCTVHFVDNTYDTGPIIVQRTCPVLESDSAESLAARVLRQEHRIYPLALRWFIEDRLVIANGIVSGCGPA